MMKYIYVCCLLLGSLNVQAQYQPYNFEVKQEPYQPLSPRWVIFDTLVWSNMYAQINYKFDFFYFARPFSEILVGTEGVLLLPDNGLFHGICPAAVSMDQRYTQPPYSSTIAYMVDSLSGPYKILKIEFRDMGFVSNDTGDFLNFQAWLYEGTNVIEFRYGPSRTINPSWLPNYTGPFVGIDSAFMDNYVLTGSPAAPSRTDDNSLALDSFPASGTVYRFSPNWQFPAGLNKRRDHTIRMFPNPTAERLFVEVPPGSTQLRILDISGRELYNRLLQDGSGLQEISVSEYSPGSYLLELQTGNERRAQHWVKE